MFTAPGAASPANNETVADRRPTLRINNSSHNSAVGPVNYFFVVAKDQAFTQIAATGIVGEGGVTQWTIDRDLDYGLTHYWRVRGTDGEITTDWSPTAVFKAPAAPAPPPGGGGGGGGIPPGAPCNSPDPQKIVECERAKYGHMSHSQMLEFVRATVRSLNRNGIAGAPFGILRKGGGTNCGGYSCDVICAGTAAGQQWTSSGTSTAISGGWAVPTGAQHPCGRLRGSVARQTKCRRRWSTAIGFRLKAEATGTVRAVAASGRGRVTPVASTFGRKARLPCSGKPGRLQPPEPT